ncbi:MAG: TldD/PmbA family protein [Ruminococcaceae bacterium]|nr:TldD/PmbA family protein [Oscillospiraceae bacterium]
MQFSEIKRILAEASAKAGISHYDVYYVKSNSVSAETFKDEISSFSSEISIGLCFRCLLDGRFGYASCEKITEEELGALVARAAENAAYIESDDEAILFEGSPSYRTVENQHLPMPSAAELRELALKLQKQTYAESEFVVDGTESSVGVSEISIDLCNSYGLSLHKEASVYSAVAAAVVKKEGESEDDYEYRLGKSLEDTCAISQKAVSGALAKLGAEELTSGNYPVIISGKQMAILLDTFSGVFSAKNVKLGLSLLAGKEGEKIASEKITLVDDPYSENLLAKSPFDAEGVSTETKTVIKDGVLQTLLYDLATAAAMGKKTTANASKAGYASAIVISPYYFGIEAGEASLDKLFAEAEGGVYITQLKGLHAGANAVTGDFSIESAGFLIENGKKGRPVKSFTIAGNFYDLLKDIENISDTVTVGVPGVFRAVGAPDVFLKNISIAGK